MPKKTVAEMVSVVVHYFMDGTETGVVVFHETCLEDRKTVQFVLCWEVDRDTVTCGPFTIKLPSELKDGRHEFDLMLRDIPCPLGTAVTQLYGSSIGLRSRPWEPFPQPDLNAPITWGNPHEVREAR